LEESGLGEVIIDTARVSDKGQVVIPKEVRERLGIRNGTRLIVVLVDDAIVMKTVEGVSDRLKARVVISRAKSIMQRLGLPF
jgi:AbrB family looped-hinge helix DNA binding protein